MTIDRFRLLLAQIIEVEMGFSRERAVIYASSFVSLKQFLSVPKQKLCGPIGVDGKPAIRISSKQMEVFDEWRKKSINTKLDIADNYIAVMSRRFALRQVDMVRNITLERLNVNPLLVQVLNIHDPSELIRLHVEMAASRSIVTSMGFYLEQLVWASSECIERAPRESNWDFKLTRRSRTHWLQIKSGPNDMDKDQISHWAKKIAEKISEGNDAHIGFAYGKKSTASVSLGLLKKYLPDWEVHVLVGKDLWHFLSGEKDYSHHLCNILRQTAMSVLKKDSILTEIAATSARVTQEFVNRYGVGERAVERFIREIL
jgi:hypothetical protein